MAMSEETKVRAKEAQVWIETLTGEAFSHPDDFHESLKSGVQLCKLLNAIIPGTIPEKKINKSTMPFKCMENISYFLKAAREMGVPDPDLFETLDLWGAKDMLLVVNCLHSLGSTAQEIPTFQGPHLGIQRSTANKREFSQAQLQAGRAMPTALTMGNSEMGRAAAAEMLNPTSNPSFQEKQSSPPRPAASPPPAVAPAPPPPPASNTGESLIGKQVVVSGLVSKAEMNGVSGVVTGFDPQSERFSVKVMVNGEETVAKLKEANINEIQPQAPPPPPPAAAPAPPPPPPKPAPASGGGGVALPKSWSQGPAPASLPTEDTSSTRAKLPSDYRKCFQCGKAVVGGDVCFNTDDGKVHEQCHSAYLQAKAQKCASCGQPVTRIEGLFSGTFFVTPEGTQVHQECLEDYSKASSEKCFQCHQGISPGAVFYTTDDGKVHQECIDLYRQSKAPSCAHCSKPVTKIDGQFSGKSYNMDNVKVHEECFDAYRIAKAPKCFHCGEAIISIGGKFSGKFFDMPGKGKLHAECKESAKKCVY